MSSSRRLEKQQRSDRRSAVRETGVSRHQGSPIEGPPETPRTSQYYRIEGIKGWNFSEDDSSCRRNYIRDAWAYLMLCRNICSMRQTKTHKNSFNFSRFFLFGTKRNPIWCQIYRLSVPISLCTMYIKIL